MEVGSAEAPLTNGLADNSYWRLGIFYVNREDPSILVEERFGIGYTTNWGNWKAVAIFGTYLAVFTGLTAMILIAWLW